MSTAVQASPSPPAPSSSSSSSHSKRPASAAAPSGASSARGPRGSPNGAAHRGNATARGPAAGGSSIVSQASVKEAERAQGRPFRSHELKQFELVRELKPDWNSARVLEFCQKHEFDEVAISRELTREFEFERPSHSSTTEEWKEVPKKELKKKDAPAPLGGRPGAPGSDRPKSAVGGKPGSPDARPNGGGFQPKKEPHVLSEKALAVLARIQAQEAKKKAAEEAKKKEVQLPVPGKSYANAFAAKLAPSPTASPPPAAAAPAAAAGAAGKAGAAPAKPAQPAAAAPAAAPAAGAAKPEEKTNETQQRITGPGLARMGHIGNNKNPAVAQIAADKAAAAAAAAPAPAATSTPASSPATSTTTPAASPAVPTATPSAAPAASTPASSPAASPTTPSAAPSQKWQKKSADASKTAATAAPKAADAAAPAPAATPASPAKSATAAPAAAMAAAPALNPRVSELYQSQQKVLLPSHLAAQVGAGGQSQFQFRAGGDKLAGPRAPRPKDAPQAAQPQQAAVQPVGAFAAAPAAIGSTANRPFGGVLASGSPASGPAPIGSKMAGHSLESNPLTGAGTTAGAGAAGPASTGSAAAAAADSDIIAGGHPSAHHFPTQLHDNAHLGSNSVTEAPTTSHYDNTPAQYSTFGDALSGNAPAVSYDGSDAYAAQQDDSAYAGYGADWRNQQKRQGQQGPQAGAQGAQRGGPQAGNFAQQRPGPNAQGMPKSGAPGQPMQQSAQQPPMGQQSARQGMNAQAQQTQKPAPQPQQQQQQQQPTGGRPAVGGPTGFPQQPQQQASQQMGQSNAYNKPPQQAPQQGGYPQQYQGMPQQQQQHQQQQQQQYKQSQGLNAQQYNKQGSQGQQGGQQGQVQGGNQYNTQGNQQQQGQGQGQQGGNKGFSKQQGPNAQGGNPQYNAAYNQYYASYGGYGNAAGPYGNMPYSQYGYPQGPYGNMPYSQYGQQAPGPFAPSAQRFPNQYGFTGYPAQINSPTFDGGYGTTPGVDDYTKHPMYASPPTTAGLPGTQGVGTDGQQLLGAQGGVSGSASGYDNTWGADALGGGNKSSKQTDAPGADLNAVRMGGGGAQYNAGFTTPTALSGAPAPPQSFHGFQPHQAPQSHLMHPGQHTYTQQEQRFQAQPYNANQWTAQ